MTIRTCSILGLAVVGLITSGIHRASAQGATPFASFDQGTFAFVNSGSSSQFFSGTGSSAANIPVQFTYNVANSSGHGIGDTFNAALKLSSVVDGMATEDQYGNIQQNLKTVSIQFFDTDPGANFGKSLLTVTGTADISGVDSSLNATFEAIASASNVQYSSAFLTSATLASLNGSTASHNTQMDLYTSTGLTVDQSNGYLNSFTSVTKSGIGNFYGAQAVPEMGTMVGLGFFVISGGLFGLRRRSQA